MYIIEGNIGAGKSTFLRLISHHLPEIKTVDEPVDSWQNTVYGKSLLTNFYEDPQRWAYTFELLTMMSRMQSYLQHDHQGTLHIAERSIYSGFYCFARNSYAQRFMNDLEWQAYQEWFAQLTHQCSVPKGFIYLRVSPEIAYERIKKRKRHAEKTITLAYLKQIHQQHESFLIKKDTVLPVLQKIPVLTLDCTVEFECNPAQMHRHIHALQTFFMQTGSLVAPYRQRHAHQSAIV